MKNTIKVIVLFIGILFFNIDLLAQEELPHFKAHSMGYYTGISFIPGVVQSPSNQDEKTTLIVRSVGLNYSFHLSEEWTIGGVYDLQFATFQVLHGEGLVTRNNVMVLCVYGGYEFHHFGITVGPGIEFERSENLFVIRTSFEYNLYLANNWWIVPELSFEIKEYYSNYNIGFKLLKNFGKPVREALHR